VRQQHKRPLPPPRSDGLSIKKRKAGCESVLSWKGGPRHIRLKRERERKAPRQKGREGERGEKPIDFESGRPCQKGVILNPESPEETGKEKNYSLTEGDSYERGKKNTAALAAALGQL